ncbi:MAG: NEW3 domain-containing protein [Desulfobacterota bacterium]|nr:NEW3 domain-containing protein [Thermodesulfobacteriota bacterium]
MGRRVRYVSQSLFILALAALFLSGGFLMASEEKEKKDTRPERGIAVYPEYSTVSVGRGETVRMDLTLENKGRNDETIDVRISSVPKGWRATMKGGGFHVSGMYVANGKSRNLTLTLEPDKTVGPGSYTFQFDAQTSDGKFTSSHKLTVNVLERVPGAEELQITTSYPVLRGQPDALFEFSLEVTNKSDSDRTVNLSAIGPEKWEINFKPSWETKQISSLVMKGGQSQTVKVEVSPQRDSKAGEYPILVRVSAGEQKAEARLMVVLTGTYKLDAGTPTGILSLETMVGKPATVSLFVKNTGSAINRNISFSSFKPENWEVKFNPEKIEALEPNQLKQVEVTITPAKEALVGDYSVGLMVDGERGSSKTVELRTTVRASTTWGWVGIGIIVFVIAGLCALFIWLGRR